jgi:hypothetical protein
MGIGSSKKAHVSGAGAGAGAGAKHGPRPDAVCLSTESPTEAEVRFSALPRHVLYFGHQVPHVRVALSRDAAVGHRAFLTLGVTVPGEADPRILVLTCPTATLLHLVEARHAAKAGAGASEVVEKSLPLSLVAVGHRSGPKDAAHTRGAAAAESFVLRLFMGKDSDGSFCVKYRLETPCVGGAVAGSLGCACLVALWGFSESTDPLVELLESAAADAGSASAGAGTGTGTDAAVAARAVAEIRAFCAVAFPGTRPFVPTNPAAESPFVGTNADFGFFSSAHFASRSALHLVPEDGARDYATTGLGASADLSFDSELDASFGEMRPFGRSSGRPL